MILFFIMFLVLLCSTRHLRMPVFIQLHLGFLSADFMLDLATGKCHQETRKGDERGFKVFLPSSLSWAVFLEAAMSLYNSTSCEAASQLINPMTPLLSGNLVLSLSCGPRHVQVLLFSHSVMSNSLRPRGLQRSRLPCPSPSSGVCSNLCPISR